MHAVATTVSTRIYLRLQEIHTAALKTCLLPSVTRVTCLQSKGVTKDIRQTLDCSWQLPLCLPGLSHTRKRQHSCRLQSKDQSEWSSRYHWKSKGTKQQGSRWGTSCLQAVGVGVGGTHPVFPLPPLWALHPAGSTRWPLHSQYSIMQLRLLC